MTVHFIEVHPSDGLTTMTVYLIPKHRFPRNSWFFQPVLLSPNCRNILSRLSRLSSQRAHSEPNGATCPQSIHRLTTPPQPRFLVGDFNQFPCAVGHVITVERIHGAAVEVQADAAWQVVWAAGPVNVIGIGYEG